MQYDSFALRERLLPLPTPQEGYTRVLFLGTTGAGKTSLVRQFLGTHPVRENFPTSSASKTTTSDMEIILAEGTFQALVSFLPRQQVQTYVEECITAAVLACLEQRKPRMVALKFLEHSEQRFRLKYLLGRLPPLEDEYSLEEIEEEELENYPFGEEEAIPAGSSQQEQQQQDESIRRYLQEIHLLGVTLQKEMEAQPDFPHDSFKKEERNAFIETFLEQELSAVLTFQHLVAAIMEDIQHRFRRLSAGKIVFDNTSGWPVYWQYEAEERKPFLSLIKQFSSNNTALYGSLFTPLVQGIRLKAPFHPLWAEGGIPPLVLIDGEGLGHTPDTSSSLSTQTTARFDHVDAILLVDNAKQPMQAAPYAVLRDVALSGHVSKLFVCFTHFEEVEGDNFANVQDKKDHVLSSLDNVITAISKESGSYNGAALRNRVEQHVFFFSHLNTKSPLHHNQMDRLKMLTEELMAFPPFVDLPNLQPVYQEKHLLPILYQAVFSFREAWQGRLGLNPQSSRHPEHWTRIKALSRRPAEMGLDEYDTLRPVADLIQKTMEQIKQFLDHPLTWVGADYRGEEDRQEIIDAIARELYTFLHTVARQRLILEPLLDWQIAHSRYGTGSTKVRAHDIEQIYQHAVPLPDERSEVNLFLANVVEELQRILQLEGGKLV